MILLQYSYHPLHFNQTFIIEHLSYNIRTYTIFEILIPFKKGENTRFSPFLDI